jgi:predicted RNase H-like HicB family nuclease
MKQFFVRAEWDNEANVWYVAETDLPGLAVEGDTLEEFTENVRESAIDLVELNADLIGVDGPYPIEITTHQEMKICA